MNCPKTGTPCQLTGCTPTSCRLDFMANNFIQPMGFQLCPKCNGDGDLARYNSPNTYSDVPVCDVCNGKKIISVVTGKPPE